jgi:hypothetical protein
MVVIMHIHNHLGEWKSKPLFVTEEQYEGLLEVSKNFYVDGGFEMPLDDGIVIIPPDITRVSVLTIKVIEEDD